MSCPRCGYSGHNSVYHWGTGETECDRCRHDYVSERRSSKKKEESFGFLNLNTEKTAGLSNDVWLLPYGKTSIGGKALGSKYIGQVVNGRVVDHRSNVIGRVDLMGNFEKLRW